MSARIINNVSLHSSVFPGNALPATESCLRRITPVSRSTWPRLTSPQVWMIMRVGASLNTYITMTRSNDWRIQDLRHLWSHQEDGGIRRLHQQARQEGRSDRQEVLDLMRTNIQSSFNFHQLRRIKVVMWPNCIFIPSFVSQCKMAASGKSLIQSAWPAWSSLVDIML